MKINCMDLQTLSGNHVVQRKKWVNSDHIVVLSICLCQTNLIYMFVFGFQCDVTGPKFNFFLISGSRITITLKFINSVKKGMKTNYHWNRSFIYFQIIPSTHVSKNFSLYVFFLYFFII